MHIAYELKYAINFQKGHRAVEFGPKLNSDGRGVLVINTALGFARKQIEYYSKLSVMVLAKEDCYIN